MAMGRVQPPAGASRRKGSLFRVRLLGDARGVQAACSAATAAHDNACKNIFSHRQVVGEATAPGRLPAVFPIVVYNGEAAWSARPDVAELGPVRAELVEALAGASTSLS